MTSLGSSRICNGHRISLSIDEVYVMQDVLATMALAAAVTYHSGFVVICVWAFCSFYLRVFGRTDLSR
jgi:hypothetical protein